MRDQADKLAPQSMLERQCPICRQCDRNQDKVDVRNVEAGHVVDENGEQAAIHWRPPFRISLVKRGFDGTGRLESLSLTSQPSW